MTISGVIKDAGPDSWGQRVIGTRLTGNRGSQASESELVTGTISPDRNGERPRTRTGIPLPMRWA